MSYKLRYDRRFMRHLKALPGDVRSVAHRQVKALTDNPRPTQAKELDDHPSYYRLWLPRGCRLVWQVLEVEQVVDLLYIGPKSPHLYEQLGLGRK
jgi:mRNA-degrading endonuclease RelE of RelBE toxin-antitoxin system